MLALLVGTKPLLQTKKEATATGIWWFKTERPTPQASIPDIFKRNGLVVSIRYSLLLTFHMHIYTDRFFSFDFENSPAARRPSRGL